MTHRAVLNAPAPAVRTSTTRITLWRLQIGLLVGTAAVLVAAFAVFELGHLTAVSVSAKGAPAVLGVAAAQQELLQADDLAMRGFGDDYRPMGVVTRYQNEITLAEQKLERVAETNAAGPAGSAQLQLVTGLIVGYTNTLQLAAADYDNGKGTFGAAQAWAASEEMRKSDGGIVNDLGQLRVDEERAVRDQVHSFWTSPWSTLLWIGPSVALLVVLVLAQRYLAGRFRRRFNGPLLLATVLLAVLAGGATFALVTDHQLAVAGADVERVLAHQPAQVAPSELGVHLAADCQQARTPDCDIVPATFQGALDACHGVTPDQHAEAMLRDLIATATAEANRAAVSDGAEIAIPSVAVLVAVLIVLGLRPRIDEYRYRT
jgi:hypothetical protein